MTPPVSPFAPRLGRFSCSVLAVGPRLGRFSPRAWPLLSPLGRFSAVDRSAMSYTKQDVMELSGLADRTIRNYVKRGLLPAPKGHGLAAEYDEEHMVRAVAIGRMRAQGDHIDVITERIAEWKTAQFKRFVGNPRRSGSTRRACASAAPERSARSHRRRRASRRPVLAHLLAHHGHRAHGRRERASGRAAHRRRDSRAVRATVKAAGRPWRPGRALKKRLRERPERVAQTIPHW